MTEDYLPNAYISNFASVNRNRPAFTRQVVREMLSDPRIIYGLWLLKGPILSKGPRRKESEQSGTSPEPPPFPRDPGHPHLPAHRFVPPPEPPYAKVQFTTPLAPAL